VQLHDFSYYRVIQKAGEWKRNVDSICTSMPDATAFRTTFRLDESRRSSRDQAARTASNNLRRSFSSPPANRLSLDKETLQ